MKNKKAFVPVLALGAVAVGLFLGWLIFKEDSASGLGGVGRIETEAATTWTCSMHPQIRQAERGKCPICGMDLIPLESSSENSDPLELKMSATAMQLADVRTSSVQKKQPVKEIRLTGKVKVDESRVFTQATHIPGRIERLRINYTGEMVRTGQVIATVYSPELVTAQEELFEALRVRKLQPELYSAARKKLANWKLSDDQIDQIVARGEAIEKFPIRADVSGIVTNKRVSLGDYVSQGQSLMEVADLSKVWVLFDVYESDLPWIKLGDEISFTTNSIPGETFVGRITFIDPVVNPRTRVSSARLEMVNKGGRLKPDMFVTGTSSSPLGDVSEALVVPKSAVMWTGERSVVYIKQDDPQGTSFKMREVLLGPALGDQYLIKEGLAEGEEIATHGTFSIDAAAQLAGKPSMMNPNAGHDAHGHEHVGADGDTDREETSTTITLSNQAKARLSKLFLYYLDLKNALVQTDFESAIKQAKELETEIWKVDMALFQGEAHSAWMLFRKDVKPVLENLFGAKDVDGLRHFFKPLSAAFIDMAVTFGPFEEVLYIQHCPMADQDNGADWISTEPEIRNPYFGDLMLNCGEVKKEIK